MNHHFYFVAFRFKPEDDLASPEFNLATHMASLIDKVGGPIPQNNYQQKISCRNDWMYSFICTAEGVDLSEHLEKCLNTLDADNGEQFTSYTYDHAIEGEVVDNPVTSLDKVRAQREVDQAIHNRRPHEKLTWIVIEYTRGKIMMNEKGLMAAEANGLVTYEANEDHWTVMHPMDHPEWIKNPDIVADMRLGHAVCQSRQDPQALWFRAVIHSNHEGVEH